MLGAPEEEATVLLEPLQLLQRLAGDEHRLLLLPGLEGILHQGQAVAVGSNHLDRALLEFEQRAIELKAGLLGRDGEDDLGDHLLQITEGDLHRFGFANIGESREILG